ncbi:hypothetical protein [Streptacidiphilus sp. PAMC 29251]
MSPSRVLTWVFDLKQVRRYLEEPVLRIKARERVKALIGLQTRVVVGHSLGSPLGIPMVFDRLLPAGAADRAAATWCGRTWPTWGTWWR